MECETREQEEKLPEVVVVQSEQKKSWEITSRMSVHFFMLHCTVLQKKLTVLSYYRLASSSPAPTPPGPTWESFPSAEPLLHHSELKRTKEVRYIR